MDGGEDMSRSGWEERRKGSQCFVWERKTTEVRSTFKQPVKSLVDRRPSYDKYIVTDPENLRGSTSRRLVSLGSSQCPTVKDWLYGAAPSVQPVGDRLYTIVLLQRSAAARTLSVAGALGKVTESRVAGLWQPAGGSHDARAGLSNIVPRSGHQGSGSVSCPEGEAVKVVRRPPQPGGRRSRS
ncbi:unnamed protein product [Arctogadus glacialis]